MCRFGIVVVRVCRVCLHRGRARAVHERVKNVRKARSFFEKHFNYPLKIMYKLKYVSPDIRDLILNLQAITSYKTMLMKNCEKRWTGLSRSK